MPAAIRGIVAPNTVGGQSLLSTPVGLLALAVQSPLPTGSRVELAVVAPPLPRQPGATIDPRLAEPMPAVAGDAIVALLRDAIPDQVERLVAHLPPHLVFALHALLAAGQAVDGDLALAAQTLTNATDHAASRDALVRMAVAGAANEAARPSEHGSNHVVPLIIDGQPATLRLAVRPFPGERDSAEGARQSGGGTRFIVDVDLSRLGPLQLDGLVTRKSSRLDLAIRTLAALPDPAPRDITALFTRTLQAFNLAGVITFRSGERFVAPEPAAPAHGLLI